MNNTINMVDCQTIIMGRGAKKKILYSVYTEYISNPLKGVLICQSSENPPSRQDPLFLSSLSVQLMKLISGDRLVQ